MLGVHAAGLVGLWCILLVTGSAAVPPHIIFHVVDDLGWNDLGYQRGALPNQTNAIRSPHIDSLALGGIRLHDYATFKFCSPARSQFLAGRYAYHLGQQTTINLPGKKFPKPCALPLQYDMMPAVLRKAGTGYVSRSYGKWHQGFLNESYTPVGRGFDSFFGFYDGGQSYYTHITPYGVWWDASTPLWWTPSNLGCKGCGSNATRPLSKKLLKVDRCGALVDLADDKRGKDGKIQLAHAAATLNGTHSTELMAARVVADIGAHNVSKPLYAYVAWHAVHDPLQVDALYMKPYEGAIEDVSRRTLAGMISNLDLAIENITKALKARGMWANTVTVLTTDNGGPVCLNMSSGTQRGEQSKRDCGTNNWPLRGSKMTLWEGGVRGIGFIIGDILIPKSMRSATWSGMSHGTDWYVSLLALAGVSKKLIVAQTGPLPPDGLDIFTQMLANETSPRTELVHNIDEASKSAKHVGAIRVGDWKLLKGYPGCTTNGSNTPSNPRGSKSGCYNGVDFAWQPPEMTQPGFDYGPTFADPPPCTVRPCLFNVRQDPLEARDLASAQPAKLKQMLARYEQLRQSEVSVEQARLCPVAAPDGCVANLASGVWAPWVK